MGRTLPTVNSDYIVGLTDGEGCFYVNVWNSSAYRAGAAVQLHFHLKLQASDRKLLEAVREHMGCGAVYFQKETRANHTHCYRYTVSAQRDILRTVIPFFKKHPLQSPSKRASFERFCAIAELIEAGIHRNIDGIQQIRALKAGMNLRTVGLA